LGCWTC